MRVSIIIPTYKESPQVVTGLAQQAQAVLTACGAEYVEVIVVDDSPEQPNYNKQDILLIHRTNPVGGLSGAVVEGIKRSGGQLIAVMDGDGQHPPAALQNMYAAIVSGDDFVVASRYVKGGNAGGLDGPHRRLVSVCSAGLAHLFLPQTRHVKDLMSGFFMFRANRVDENILNPIGFKIMLELLVKSRATKIVEVPFTFGSRIEGTSKASLKQGLLFFKHLLRLVFWQKNNYHTMEVIYESQHCYPSQK